MSGKSAGASPDYTGAALEMAKYGRSALDQQTAANRPNINMADGSSINWTKTPGQFDQGAYDTAAGAAWDKYIGGMPKFQGEAYANDPGAKQHFLDTWGADHKSEFYGPDQWSMAVSLNPTQQQTLEGQQGLALDRTQMAQGLMDQAGKDLANGVNWDSFGQIQNGDAARQQAIDAAYGQATSRLDPAFAQREQALQSQLANQGLSIGDEAYQTAVDNFGRERNDAYSSAMNGAIGQGTVAGQAAFQQNMAARQQGINEAQQRQYGGMNALNAFLNGQQVNTNVNAPQFNAAGMAQAPNLLGAAQSQGNYNLSAAQMQQQLMQGAMGGAGSLGMSMFGFGG